MSLLGAMKRGISMEEMARNVLRMCGYKTLTVRQRVSIDGIDVGEVDIIAEDEEGEKYLVEVKRGRVSVSDIKQAYATAKMLKLKPMVVCRDYADKAAEVVAKELEVKVIRIAEYLLVEPEELITLIKKTIQEVLEEEALGLLECLTMTDEEAELLSRIASSKSLSEGPRKGLKEALSKLRARYRLLRTAKGYVALRRRAELLLALRKLLNKR